VGASTCELGERATPIIADLPLPASRTPVRRRRCRPGRML